MKEICFISALIIFASCEVCYDETYTYSLEENSEIINYLDTAVAEFDSTLVFINWVYETINGDMMVARTHYIGEHCKNWSDYFGYTLSFQFDPGLYSFYFTDSAINNSLCHYSVWGSDKNHFDGYISGKKVNNYSWYIKYELMGRSTLSDSVFTPINGEGYFRTAIY